MQVFFYKTLGDKYHIVMETYIVMCLGWVLWGQYYITVPVPPVLYILW